MLHEHNNNEVIEKDQAPTESTASLSALNIPLNFHSIDNPLKDQTCRDIGHRLMAMSEEVQERYELNREDYEARYEEAGTLKKLYLRFRKPKDPNGAVDKDHFMNTFPELAAYEISTHLLLLYRTGLIDVTVDDIAPSESNHGRVLRGFKPNEELRRQIYKYPLLDELEVRRGSWLAVLHKRP